MQSLPLLPVLVAAVLLTLAAIRCLQWLQTHVLHMLPLGATSSISLNSICTSVLLGGWYMLYFGAYRASWVVTRVTRVTDSGGVAQCYFFVRFFALFHIEPHLEA